MSIWHEQDILNIIAENFIHAKDWENFTLVNKACYQVYKKHIHKLRYNIPSLAIFKLCYPKNHIRRGYALSICPKCFQNLKRRSNHKCLIGDYQCDICKKSYYEELMMCGCKKMVCGRCSGWCHGCDHNYCSPCLTYDNSNHKKVSYCPDCIPKYTSKCYRCNSLYGERRGKACPDCKKLTCIRCLMWCRGCKRHICRGDCAFDSRTETFICKKCHIKNEDNTSRD